MTATVFQKFHELMRPIPKVLLGWLHKPTQGKSGFITMME